MARVAFSLLLILSPVFVLAELPDTLWSVTSPVANSVIYDVAGLEDGLYLAVGDPSVRFSARGEFLGVYGTGCNVTSCVERLGDAVFLGGWSNWDACLNGQDYSSTGQCKAYDATFLSDGQVAVIGYRYNEDENHSDIWLLKWAPLEQDTLWTRDYTHGFTDIGRAIAELPNGDLLLAGETRGTEYGTYDVWLIRTDSNGQEIWSTIAGSDSDEVCYDLFVTADAAYAVGRQYTDGESFPLLVKCTLDGDVLFRNVYFQAGDESQFRGITSIEDGHLMVVGWRGNSVDLTHCWIVELDTAGNIVSELTCGPLGSKLYGIGDSFPGNGVVGIGTDDYYQPHGYMIRFAPQQGIQGIVRETQSGLPVSEVNVQSVTSGQMSATDIAGRFWLELPPGEHELITWGNCTEPDSVHAAIVTTDSMFADSFSIISPVFQTDDTMLTFTIQNHIPHIEPFSIRNVGGSEMNFEFHSHPSVPEYEWFSIEPEAGILQSGEELEAHLLFTPDTLDNHAYYYRAWLFIYLSNNCPDTERIGIIAQVLDGDDRPEAPKKFELDAVYPNPFNSFARISFTLPHAARVQIETYDILGQRVAVIADHVYSAGSQHEDIDGSNLPSGIYFIRMRAADFAASQKVLLLK